jgi:hypothetical protein
LQFEFVVSIHLFSESLFLRYQKLVDEAEKNRRGLSLCARPGRVVCFFVIREIEKQCDKQSDAPHEPPSPILFPACAIESMATRDSWINNRQMNRNNFIDQQHLMALPYADMFISDDGKLTSLAGRIAKGIPFPTAKVITRAAFDSQFPL